MDRPELLQMLEVTVVGSHAGSQALGEVYRCLTDVFFCRAALPRWSAKRLLTHQLSWASEFTVLFQHGTSYVIVSGFKSVEFGRR